MVEWVAHEQMDAGSSPTSVDHRELILDSSCSRCKINEYKKQTNKPVKNETILLQRAAGEPGLEHRDRIPCIGWGDASVCVRGTQRQSCTPHMEQPA